MTKEIFTKTAHAILYLTDYGPIEEMDEDTKEEYESQLIGRDELVANFTFPVGKEGFVEQVAPWVEKKNKEEEAEGNEEG